MLRKNGRNRSGAEKETNELKPYFELYKGLICCPHCLEGTVRYVYEYRPNSEKDFAHFGMCDNWQCAEIFPVP